MHQVEVKCEATIDDEEREFNVFGYIEPAEDEDDTPQVFITRVMWHQGIGDDVDVTSLFATLKDTWDKWKIELRWYWERSQERVLEDPPDREERVPSENEYRGMAADRYEYQQSLSQH